MKKSKSLSTIQMLNLSKWETTKGLTKSDRLTAVKNWLDHVEKRSRTKKMINQRRRPRQVLKSMSSDLPETIKECKIILVDCFSDIKNAKSKENKFQPNDKQNDINSEEPQGDNKIESILVSTEKLSSENIENDKPLKRDNKKKSQEDDNKTENEAEDISKNTEKQILETTRIESRTEYDNNTNRSQEIDYKIKGISENIAKQDLEITANKQLENDITREEALKDDTKLADVTEETKIRILEIKRFIPIINDNYTKKSQETKYKIENISGNITNEGLETVPYKQLDNDFTQEVIQKDKNKIGGISENTKQILEITTSKSLEDNDKEKYSEFTLTSPSETVSEPFSPDVSEYVPSVTTSDSEDIEGTSRNNYKRKVISPSIIEDSMQGSEEYEESPHESLSAPCSSDLYENIPSPIIPIRNIEIQLTDVDTKEQTSEKTQNDNETTSNKRIHKKRLRHPDFCFFCESDVLNFARHIKRNHSGESEVTQIFSLPASSKERKELIAKLRKKGNFVKNSSVCLKPVRTVNLKPSSEYVPCKYCLGFYSKKQLYRHVKKCNSESGAKPAYSFLADAQNVMLHNIKVDKELVELVFPRMLPDQISLVAKRDKIICKFGARYLKSHREKHCINVCSRKMRELSRLLIEIQKANPSIPTLFDALRPENFDLFVECTKAIAKYDPIKDNYQSPTYAMNIQTSLKQCCDIAILNVLKHKSFGHTVAAAELENCIKTFKQLLTDSWRFEVSTKAAADLSVQKWNKVSMVPLAADLKMFKEFLERKSSEAAISLKRNSLDYKSYQLLLETVFCRLLLLNRKRIGELQRMPLLTYLQVDSNCQNYEEFADAITPTEKILLKRFKRVVIRGKRGRGVPVLFSAELQKHTDLLIQVRNNFIPETNTFLFGNKNSNNPITGYKILQKHARLSQVKNPNALTSTRLRKHLATLSQLFAMSETDVEQLATFMGHTQNIHRQVYRLPDDVYQTAKITKLLLLMEKGQAAEFKGKKLDEIDIDLEMDIPEEDNDFEDNEEEQNDYDEREHYIPLEQPSTSSSFDTIPQPITKKRKLIPWTEEQKDVAKTFFRKHIKNKQPPKRREIEEMTAKNPSLFDNKTWPQIKVFIQNQYSKKY